MPAISGSLASATASAAVDVKPGETISINVNILPAQTFGGLLVIQRSADGGQSWQTDRSPAGVEQSFDGQSVALTAGTVTSYVQKNDSTSRVLYRANVLVLGAANGVDFALATNTPGAVKLACGPGWAEYCEDVLINAADIIATAAGKFGHASGFPLAVIRADQVIELVSALMQTDRRTAAYTAGGNITVNLAGGAAVTGLVSAANSLGAAADATHLFLPLAAAANALTAGAGLNLVAAAAFTNPGTAAGVVRVRVRYRVHDLALTA